LPTPIHHFHNGPPSSQVHSLSSANNNSSLGSNGSNHNNNATLSNSNSNNNNNNNNPGIPPPPPDNYVTVIPVADQYGTGQFRSRRSAPNTSKQIGTNHRKKTKIRTEIDDYGTYSGQSREYYIEQRSRGDYLTRGAALNAANSANTPEYNPPPSSHHHATLTRSIPPSHLDNSSVYSVSQRGNL
ncbi:Uncharacterized protein FKW44_000825, partial [Caligus rogercresseyi]